MKTTIKVTKDNTRNLEATIKDLASRRVLVGVPSENALRPDVGEINNAMLLYIHSHGAPEINLPARPSMEPTIKENEATITGMLEVAGKLALSGGPEAVERQLHRVGLFIVDKIRERIQAGIPPPLKEATVRKRMRRSKGSSYRRQASTPEQAVPLIDTGAMLRALTYVVEEHFGLRDE